MEEEITLTIKLRLTKMGQRVMSQNNYAVAKTLATQISEKLSVDKTHFKGVSVDVATRKV